MRKFHHCVRSCDEQHSLTDTFCFLLSVFRLGVSEEVFSRWNLAVVKELKASLVNEVYSDMDAETIDCFPMARLEEVCGAQFEDIMNLGLEHADPKPSTTKYTGGRRQEQGIRIRQN